MTVMKLTERLGLTEAGITVGVDTDWNKQRAAATRQGITRTLADFLSCLPSVGRF